MDRKGLLEDTDDDDHNIIMITLLECCGHDEKRE